MNVFDFKKNILYQTTQYEMFDLHIENRDLQDTKNLEISMRKNGFISAYPLHVKRLKDRLIIKGGHHRFFVAQKLKIPLWFVITDDDAGLIDLEIPANPWVTRSYLESMAKAGNPDYKELLEFKNKTGLSLRNCASLLGGESAESGNQIQKIKRLSFKAKNSDFAHAVANLVLWLKENGLAHAKNTRFVGAISKLMQLPEFNVRQFKERVLINMHIIIQSGTEKQFIENLDYVYNKASRNKIPLSFMVDELMKKKQTFLNNSKGFSK